MLAVAIPAQSQSITGPDLGYVAVPDVFRLPPNANFGAVSGVAINSKGNIFVLSRGPQPLMEFDASGRYIRGFGEGLFDRPHGLRIDAEDNIWAIDGGGHIVMKFNPQGRVVMVLGVRGSAGEWHPYRHLRLFTEPNDVAIGPAGEIYVSQGHGKGDSRVLKFDRDGNYLKTWGKTGKEQGEFNVPHSVAVDAAGLIYVADRGNQRVQVFDAEGAFVREMHLPGTPCGLHITRDGFIYLAHGHAGQILKLDLSGKVLGVTGSQGKALGQYGEAHFLALSAKAEIYVADTLNWRVQKLVRK
jgi:DNA-binding beta-propeller fold protein YncE